MSCALQRARTISLARSGTAATTQRFVGASQEATPRLRSLLPLQPTSVIYRWSAWGEALALGGAKQRKLRNASTITNAPSTPLQCDTPLNRRACRNGSVASGYDAFGSVNGNMAGRSISAVEQAAAETTLGKSLGSFQFARKVELYRGRQVNPGRRNPGRDPIRGILRQCRVRPIRRT